MHRTRETAEPFSTATDLLIPISVTYLWLRASLCVLGTMCPLAFVAGVYAEFGTNVVKLGGALLGGVAVALVALHDRKLLAAKVGLLRRGCECRIRIGAGAIAIPKVVLERDDFFDLAESETLLRLPWDEIDHAALEVGTGQSADAVLLQRVGGKRALFLSNVYVSSSQLIAAIETIRPEKVRSDIGKR